MSHTQDCPGCKSRLRIADGITTPSVTCPRCLAEVPNPGAVAGGAAPAVPEGHRTCPRCRKTILPHYYFCPHCNAALFERLEAGAVPERDFARDTQHVSVMLILLAVLGLIGVGSFAFPLMAGAVHGQPTAVEALVIGVGVLIIIGGISLVFGRGQRSAAESILRVFAVIGGLFAGAIVLVVALFVFLFVVCLAGSGRGMFH